MPQPTGEFELNDEMRARKLPQVPKATQAVSRRQYYGSQEQTFDARTARTDVDGLTSAATASAGRNASKQHTDDRPDDSPGTALADPGLHPRLRYSGRNSNV
jgi:hypothetical protein